MKRDIMKRALASCCQQIHIPFHNSCWLSSHSRVDYSVPNTRNGFFDACVTQKFYDINLSEGIFIAHQNGEDQIIEDVYGNPNGYQTHCMDISGELMTFCVGGPRYFENNLPLANSPLWVGPNLASYIHHQDVFQDCKFVYGSPLFRQHYKFPTNPSLRGTDIQNGHWWEIDDRDSNIFEDADDYGYVATQLTHLPKFISSDVGNLLAYRPIYDSTTNESDLYLIKRSELTSSKVMLNFLRQSHTLPFRLRTDEVAVAQRDVLHDPSIYIINRKSLMVNKPHVFYNDDSSDVHCLPLAKNALKWSEGFMGDCMMIFAECRYEE